MNTLMQMQKHIYKWNGTFCKWTGGGFKVCVHFYHRYCQLPSKDDIATDPAFNNACKFLFSQILLQTV